MNNNDKIPDIWLYPKPCEGGHVFVWASNTTKDQYAPKGTPCRCGAYRADGWGGVEKKEAGDE